MAIPVKLVFNGWKEVHMKSWLEEARKASGLSPEDCASALGCSKNTYDSRENTPGRLNLNEIRVLHRTFNRDGRKILWSALKEFSP